jgi:hypothetical protein
MATTHRTGTVHQTPAAIDAVDRARFQIGRLVERYGFERATHACSEALRQVLAAPPPMLMFVCSRCGDDFGVSEATLRWLQTRTKPVPRTCLNCVDELRARREVQDEVV